MVPTLLRFKSKSSCNIFFLPWYFSFLRRLLRNRISKRRPHYIFYTKYYWVYWGCRRIKFVKTQTRRKYRWSLVDFLFLICRRIWRDFRTYYSRCDFALYKLYLRNLYVNWYALVRRLFDRFFDIYWKEL